MKSGRNLTVRESKEVQRENSSIDPRAYLLEKTNHKKGGFAKLLLRHKITGENIEIVIKQ